MNPTTGSQFAQPSQTKRFFDSGQEQLKTNRETVRVYFIGYKLLDKNGNPPIIPVKQKPVRMPPLGGYIDLDQVYYEDLRLRTQMWNPATNQFVDAVTTDAEIAKAVASAYANGRLNDDISSMVKVVQTSALTSMTDDELEAELLRRKASTQEAVSSTEDDTEDESANSTRSSSRSKKS